MFTKRQHYLGTYKSVWKQCRISLEMGILIRGPPQVFFYLSVKMKGLRVLIIHPLHTHRHLYISPIIIILEMKYSSSIPKTFYVVIFS